MYLIMNEQKPDFLCNKKNKIAAGMVIVALSNGVIYALTIPIAGGKDITDLFKISGPDATKVVRSLGAMAGVCYTMFYYKTLEFLNLKPKNRAERALIFFAPFAASSYLTGGIEGAELLPAASATAGMMGVFLFLFRIIGCVDASIKFPDRIQEIKAAFLEAYENGDAKEIARIVTTVVASIGYALCATDSVFAAVTTISGWFHIPELATSIISYICGGLGGIGMLPLSLYWIHRGLKQLTFGGKSNEQLVIVDPTDRYTYFGLLLVLPNLLGTVGAATSTQAHIFGKLGIFADITRLITGTIYAAASGVPGFSTLLRTVTTECRSINDLSEPLLPSPTDDTPNEKKASDTPSVSVLLAHSAIYNKPAVDTNNIPPPNLEPSKPRVSRCSSCVLM